MVTIRGVTGVRKDLPKYFYDLVRQVKKETSQPVCVGFGISTPQQVLPVLKYIDGIIVGSSIINIIKEFSGKERYKNLSNFIKTFQKISNFERNSYEI